MTNADLNAAANFAREAHNEANCRYDGKHYGVHLSMVEEGVDKYETVFKNTKDYRIARAGASGHDLIEDAQLTFNDIAEVLGKRVARVILAVTDVHEENRLLRHLATMGKTIKDYISIVVKMADMRANGLYSKVNGSSMYKKYVEEYEYRRPIFKKALKWYNKELNLDVLDDFWAELDEIHGYKSK
jgi:(p)ppGpp synthase/HD superfamily hydrolase